VGIQDQHVREVPKSSGKHNLHLLAARESTNAHVRSELALKTNVLEVLRH
jgi:hypothetical protein